MHIAMAQIGHNKSVGSNKMFCSNYFFTFVIMQVVLLNICLRQRWKAVMKSRLRVTPQSQRKEVKWGHVYGRAPLTPTPKPHHPSPCLCKINMRGSSKVAWIDAIRTTRYPLILMLCCDVFIFVVVYLEWPYPSCLLYGKEFFRAFRSIAK